MLVKLSCKGRHKAPGNIGLKVPFVVLFTDWVNSRVDRELVEYDGFVARYKNAVIEQHLKGISKH